MNLALQYQTLEGRTVGCGAYKGHEIEIVAGYSIEHDKYLGHLRIDGSKVDTSSFKTFDMQDGAFVKLLEVATGRIDATPL